MTNLDSILKSRDITLPKKVCLVKAMVFSCSHVWMWELDYKESWVPKNWSFWTVVLEKTLESPLDSKEIQLVHPKGNQSWIFTGRTDAEAETPMWRCEELTHLKRPWFWSRLKVGGEGDDRGWDGYMASPTQHTWVLVNSGSWWWTGRPGMLKPMGSWRVGHNWVAELNWSEVKESHSSQEKHSDPTGSQRTSWRVLGVVTVSLWLMFLLVRGNLELANALTSPCYHHIDAASDCSMYYQLSNPFCLCAGQQATTCSASSTRNNKTIPNHRK